jgi:hypothetical protein
VGRKCAAKEGEARWPDCFAAEKERKQAKGRKAGWAEKKEGEGEKRV